MVKITQPASILLPSPRITPVTLSRESARCKMPLSCDARVTSSTVPLRMSRPVEHEMRCGEKNRGPKGNRGHSRVLLYLERSSGCAACLLCKVVGRSAHGAPVYCNEWCHERREGRWKGNMVCTQAASRGFRARTQTAGPLLRLSTLKWMPASSTRKWGLKTDGRR